MRITPGGKSHDATAVKLWYEVYFLDEMEDLTGGHGTPAMVRGRHRALVFLLFIGAIRLNDATADSRAASFQWAVS